MTATGRGRRFFESTILKSEPFWVEYETRWKNLLKGKLKRQGITNAGLAEKLATIGNTENERNPENKIGGGGFTAAFFPRCLNAIGAQSLRLSCSPSAPMAQI
ncbi:DUF6471 domain-containing protein [Sphingorhabdus lacus]|uniref:DUF6471 domain-containing protein n=1 Tax=Sphingorhabdus lacus TaxID=392610 RepID=UPI00359341BA